MSSPLVSIIIPSRGRPAGLLRVIVSVLATTRNHRVEIVPVLDAPDAESRDLLNSLSRFAIFNVVVMPETYVDGHPQQKFQRGYEASTGDWIVTGTDDIVFHAGWLDAILAHPNQGIVGLYDPHHKMSTATLFAFTRAHLETTAGGRLGLPWYHVWGSDKERTEKARRAGIFTICKEAGFDHYHSCLGTAKVDERTSFASQWWKEDQVTYKAREAAGFPDDWPEV